MASFDFIQGSPGEPIARWQWFNRLLKNYFADTQPPRNRPKPTRKAVLQACFRLFLVLRSWVFLLLQSFEQPVEVKTTPFRPVAVCVLLFLSLVAHAMGERYTEQGGKLSAATITILIDKGFCKTIRECHKFLPGYVAHGDRVRIAFYEVGSKNSQAFNSIVEVVIEDGIRITKGVPITITGYRETYGEYVKSGMFSKDVKPFVILEVNK